MYVTIRKILTTFKTLFSMQFQLTLNGAVNLQKLQKQHKSVIKLKLYIPGRLKMCDTTALSNWSDCWLSIFFISRSPHSHSLYRWDILLNISFDIQQKNESHTGWNDIIFIYAWTIPLNWAEMIQNVIPASLIPKIHIFCVSIKQMYSPQITFITLSTTLSSRY